MSSFLYHDIMQISCSLHITLKLYIYCISFSGIYLQGMSMSFIGPTLVHMEILLSTDQSALGLALSLDGAGYCAGAVLCGVMYDRCAPLLFFPPP